jgi:hypothetical protein
MSARSGPFRCPFCTTSLSHSPNVLTIASRDVSAAGFVEVSTKKGTLRATPSGISNSIEGVTYSVGKGSTGGLMTVSIPSSIDNFDVHINRASQNLPAADVVVSLHRPDGASLQVSGDLAHDVIESSHQSHALLTVKNDGTLISAPTENIAQLSLGAGSRISRRTLNAGESMTVRSISGNSIEVSLKGANGGTTPFAKIPLLKNSTTIELTLSINEKGRLTFLPSRVESVRIGTSHSSGKARQTTTTTSVPSIEISEPD